MECFKAYDIRGPVPDQLNADMAQAVGRALAVHLGAQRLAMGRDVRMSSPALADAFARGACAAGADVLDLGVAGTEELYCAVGQHGLCGGVMITASHNPKDHNGLKLIGPQARPVDLDAVRALVERGQWDAPPAAGERRPLDNRRGYVEHILRLADCGGCASMRIVCDAGNGVAGPALDALARHLPFDIVRMRWDMDGDFPGGVPNHLLPEQRVAVSRAVVEQGAALGVAWDSDFDRCFLFDERGGYVDSYYLVGLLAAGHLRRHPGAAIVYEPRLCWNTLDIVERMGGRAVCSRSGHSFMKAAMRRAGALYGGEASGHHYFREFFYCDSGMLPWLMVAALMQAGGEPLSQMVAAARRKYPASDEINLQVADPAAVLERLRRQYTPQATAISEEDGLSITMPDWRFNIRTSNTEPLMRLNLETRANPPALQQHTAALLTIINPA